MITQLRRLTLLAMLTLAACTPPRLDQEEVGFGRLPPITRDYRARILSWARHFYVGIRPTGPASISDPLLIRDATGRLLWLVCVETPSVLPRPERLAFGFAPADYFSAPLERRGATLTPETCGEHPLALRPFPAFGRS